MKLNKLNFERRLLRLQKDEGLMYKGKKITFRTENIPLAINYLRKREEYLQNVNGFEEYAQKRYYSTLDKELTYIQNVLMWFNKWNLKNLTKNNIKEVYEKLETGQLKGIRGNTLKEGTKKDYYSKVLKNGFFEFIGKNNLARQVILRKFSENADVRFFNYETLKKLAKAMRYKDHELLVWLLFDTGVEINALLELKKNDFSIEKSEIGENYHILHMRQQISKKGRQTRNIDIWFERTNQLIFEHLETLQPNDNIFNFKWRNAYKFINETSKKLNLKLETPNDYIKPKDFRSSCATFFISEGWTTDEVKARLGHKPSSTVIDRYANYKGLKMRKKRTDKEEVDLKHYKQKFNEIAKHSRKQEHDINELKQIISSLATSIQKHTGKKLPSLEHLNLQLK